MSTNVPISDSKVVDAPIDSSGPPVHDDNIYVLNPMFRLRNGIDSVLLQGSSGLGSLEIIRLHRAFAVTLTLCDGNRTVADIVAATRPFVKLTDDAQALDRAKTYVTTFIREMLKTKNEREGKPQEVSDHPPVAPLLTKAEYLKHYDGTAVRTMKYNARDYLPKDDANTSVHPHQCKRENVPLELNWYFT